uniref:Glucosamine/galactosamine-6-phosphate isomerase domain-containing protein n=1 Tax=Nelumbo nucifera TaxID=4432 RepID=A0A822XWK8_NELNU|nr:TPA_asm: hypothetical protein HUJ06_026171 [Nelumbo nucifera]
MNRSEADLEYRGDSSWNSGMENRYSGVRVFDSNEELLTGLAEKLTKAPYLRTLEWSKWHLLWADENLVAKKHPDSNYRQAKEAFISKVLSLSLTVNSIFQQLVFMGKILASWLLSWANPIV